MLGMGAHGDELHRLPALDKPPVGWGGWLVELPWGTEPFWGYRAVDSGKRTLVPARS